MFARNNNHIVKRIYCRDEYDKPWVDFLSSYVIPRTRIPKIYHTTNGDGRYLVALAQDGLQSHLETVSSVYPELLQSMSEFGWHRTLLSALENNRRKFAAVLIQCASPYQSSIMHYDPNQLSLPEVIKGYRDAEWQYFNQFANATTTDEIGHLAKTAPSHITLPECDTEHPIAEILASQAKLAHLQQLNAARRVFNNEMSEVELYNTLKAAALRDDLEVIEYLLQSVGYSHEQKCSLADEVSQTGQLNFIRCIFNNFDVVDYAEHKPSLEDSPGFAVFADDKIRELRKRKQQYPNRSFDVNDSIESDICTLILWHLQTKRRNVDNDIKFLLAIPSVAKNEIKSEDQRWEMSLYKPERKTSPRLG